ncbi:MULTISPECIES: hypothetical protein [unclassified Streptomyces]|uniref:hypothetical protein n=1 Tax=unclassified Streptomyces TaxID=2593676 RepID=UPI000CD5071F|nr:MULTISPECIES: hypothetical protein [unclassified Streptomyces]
MRPIRAATRHLALIALLPLLAVAACSGAADDPDTGSPDAGEAAGAEQRPTDGEDTDSPHGGAVVPAASLTAGLVLPLDEYRISDADQEELEAARDRLISTCMARHGQEYSPAAVTATPLDPHLYLYGVDDAEVAAEHGYMHPVDLDPATYAPAYTDDLTADQELALHGDPGIDLEFPETLEEAEEMTGPELNGVPVPITGCYGQATLTINRPDADWVDPTVIFELADEAAHHADEDERLTELLGEWSGCMAGHGHEAASPLTVHEELGLGGDISGELAVEVAVADVGCKEETDLVGRWAEIDADHQRDVIEEHSGMLAEYRAQHEERMERAREMT